MLSSEKLRSYLHDLPKVELHLHLEGSIPIPALWEIICKYASHNEVASLHELQSRFQFRDFAHFIEVYAWKNRFLREPDDFTFVADKVAESLIAENIVYAEIFYSPNSFRHRGLETGRITEAIRKGLSKHASRIEVSLVADLTRDHGIKWGERLVDEVSELKELGVVGIGLGGSEQFFPAEPFAYIFGSSGFRVG